MTYVVQAHGRVELTNDNLQKVFRTNNCVQTHMYIHQTAFCTKQVFHNDGY